MKLRVPLTVLAICVIAAGNCPAQAVTKPDARQFSPAEQEVWAQEETYWRSPKADDRETYLSLWDERFIGWPRYDSAPADKGKIRQEYAPGTTVRGKVLDYKLEPLSVRAYGKDVAITFYRATIGRRKPSSEVETRTSRLSHTWMRTDQGWKIIGGMSAEGDQDASLTQSSPVAANDTDFRTAMVKRHQAMIDGDESVVDRLTAKEYGQTDILGHVQDKPAWIAEYFRPLATLVKVGKFRWERYDEQDVRVTMLGDTAVVTGELAMKGTGAKFTQGKWEEAPGTSNEGTLRFTRVWIKRDRTWLLVALHNSTPLGVQTSRP